MTETTDYDPVTCPASDCTYHDAVRSVAGHVGRSDDDAHSWDRLGYDGARDFVMTEKRRQRGELDTTKADTEEMDQQDHSRESPETEASDFELGFERDALVLLELARKYDLSSLDSLGTAQLADLYSLLADLKNSSEAARKEVRDELLKEVHQDGTISADLGSVNRTTYEYRQLRDEERIRTALDDADVDPEEVRGFDKSKLKDAIEDSGLDEDAVFNIEERPQIRISESNDDRRTERFERLESEIRSLADDE
jgi:hypothetical protein